MKPPRISTEDILLGRPAIRGVLTAGESPEYTLSWGTEQDWELGELPRSLAATKGGPVKTRLRQAHLRIFQTEAAIYPSNVLRRLSAKDLESYDTIKAAIHREIVKVSLEAGLPSYTRQAWSERQVHYLKVAPADASPIRAEAKDFTVKASWTEFQAYSPDSDFQLLQPNYTVVESSSATAARLLYKALLADPEALESVTWHGIYAWLDARGIKYKTRFSQWT